MNTESYITNIEVVIMEFEFLDMDSKDKPMSVWDKLVPIVKNGNEYHMYITSEIEAPTEYNEMCYTLKNVCNSKDTVYIHLNTPGGRMDSANMIISAIRSSDAYVIAVLSGEVASAGTMIALECDSIETDGLSIFMIHMYSSGSSGAKGHELKTQQIFMDKYIPTIYKDIYGGFLTDEELAGVLEDKDIWLSGDEVVNRFENRRGITNKDK